MTTDELEGVYDLAYDHAYNFDDGPSGLLVRHRAGLDAVAETTAQVWMDYFYGPKVEAGPEKLSPQLIGRIITIEWAGMATRQAITGRLAAYTDIEDYGFRLWFEGTHHEGYLLTDAFTVTVHGGV